MKKKLLISTDSERVFGLDILRAVAILFVVMAHGDIFVPKVLLPYYVKLVYDGVGIFFVLSGFLIGGILIKQIENYKFNFNSLLHFWSKRWSRTLPNYFLFLIILSMIEYLRNPDFRIFNYLKYFVFSQNLTSAPPKFFFHSWSLSVEEWFYIIIPTIIFLLVVVFKRKFKKSFLLIILLIIIIVTIFRFLQLQNIENEEAFTALTYSVLYRFDALMYGMLGAYISYYYPLVWSRNRMSCFLVFILLLILHFVLKSFTFTHSKYYYKSFVFSLTSLTVLFSLPYLSTLRKNSENMCFRILTKISLISYSLYLANYIIVDLVSTLVDRRYIMHILQQRFSIITHWSFPLVFNYILSVFLSFLIATLIYKYFEIPTTKYFRRCIKTTLEKK